MKVQTRTHPIGPGTCNITANMFLEEADVLSRVAIGRHVNRSELIRELIAIGLERISPENATAFKQVRAQHVRLAHISG